MEKRKISQVLRDNLQKLTIILLSVLYISQGLFTFSKKNATILEILGSVAISLVVGMLITASLISQGLRDGRRDNLFKASQTAYAEAKEKATPFFDKLSFWCRYKNAKELEWKKKDIISTAGLSWKGFIYGYYEDNPSNLTDEQKKAIIEAKNCKITKLTSNELLSDLPETKKKNGKRFGMDERDYRTKTSVVDLVTRLLTAIISGLYTLSPLINGENYQEVLANMLWNASQVALWLVFGATKYENAKSFILDEYRQTHIIQKTEYLNEFRVTMEKNPKVIEDFNEEEEINKYIEEYIKNKGVNINE